MIGVVTKQEKRAAKSKARINAILSLQLFFAGN